MGCPSDSELDRLVAGVLDVAARRRIAEHGESCEDCRRLLAALVGGEPGAPDPAALTAQPTDPVGPLATPTDELADTIGHGPAVASAAVPGTTIGRFVVLSRLGQGGMGTVLAAYDETLDRKVAIKLLRPGGSDSADGTARLLREARSMARLVHPNVLTIHEVGLAGDQVFLAIEFAAGGTLRAWLQAERRTWRDVVDKFVQAGRGLGAAHAAGLVHRDFKPDNVLLDADGAVRVADFGLVGRAGPAPARHLADAAREPDPGLTQTGAVLGTPAYMAPEQHAGREVDARADQYSFCVALYEALYGVRPFDGATYAELAGAIAAGRTPEPPADTAVPRWVRAVVLRGLARDPADRFPSMADLVAALEHDPELVRGRRRRGVAAGLAFATLAAAAAYGLLRAGPARCAGAAERLEGAWDDARRAEVRAAFLGTGRPYAADVYERVAQRLDAHAGAWVQEHTSACAAARVRGEQSDELLDLRMRCLDRRLGELAATVDLFRADPDGEVLDRSIRMASGLGGLDDCRDADALRAVLPRPADPVARARLFAIEGDLAETAALIGAGKYQLATAVNQRAVAAAREVGYPPPLAQALYQRARLEERAADHAAAQATLHEAVHVASLARDDSLSAAVLVELLAVVGERRGRLAEAEHLLPLAEAFVARAGNRPRQRADLLVALGGVRHAQGDAARARAAFEEAVRLREQLHGPDHPEVAAALNALAVATRGLGELDVAVATYERALGVFESSFGRGHPTWAQVLGNLSAALLERGEYDEARARAERALAVLEAAGHPVAAQAHVMLGRVDLAQGRAGDALAAFERALSMLEQTDAPNLSVVAKLHYNIGIALLRLARTAEGRAAFERALAVQEQQLGPDHPDLAATLNGLARAQTLAGDDEAALASLRRSATILEQAYGPLHPDRLKATINLTVLLRGQGRHDEARVLLALLITAAEGVDGLNPALIALALYGLGEAELALGRPAAAVAAAERALGLRTGREGDPSELAHVRYLLARALWEVGRERARALAEARQARDVFAEIGAPAAEYLTEVEAWLRGHRLRRR